MVRFGIDRIHEERELLQGRAALITAPSGRTADNRSSVERLREVCDLRLLLAPEHGVRGDKAAGESFENGIDGPSGLPVMSLYSAGSKRLPRTAMELFDTLVYDIQDVGCRHYTFISTLKNALEDCAAAGKRVVVLDRPDPLGDRVEGTVLRAETASFVGCYDIPARYGLTCGEFARMVNGEQKLGCDLHVVRCEGLRRGMDFYDWGRVWVMPSLAMPRFETALLYPATCLLEGTNLSEGRGTADPFGIVGAPYIRAEELARQIEALGEPGVAATPVWFTPAASKHKGVLCGGVQLHVTDRKALRPVYLGIRLIKLLTEHYPEEFRLLSPSEGDELPFISRLAGHRLFETADWSPEELIRQGERESAAFARRCEPWRLYE
ncbi:MAG: DUF1343 domain-containing protein [Clostridia bacterium]|nr:DUF1343 domain-containing protein [Clostridia bacterium]